MTRTILMTAALAMLGGCALAPFRHHHAAAQAERTPASAQAAAVGGGTCRPDLLKVLEGRPGSAVLAARALDLSGARTVRWMHPGDVVTMDFRADRLNIRLTRANIVKGFACG